MAFGIGKHGSLVAFAKGSSDCQLRRLPIAALVEHDVSEQLAGQVDTWITEFVAAIAAQIEPRPRPDTLLNPKNPGEPLKTAGACILSARAGGVVWIAAGKGDAAYLGTEEWDSAGTGFLPLTSDSWVSLQCSASVSSSLSRALYEKGVLFAALGEFHQLALGAEQLIRRLLVADEANEQTARTLNRRQEEQRARQSLFSVLGPRHAAPAEDGSPLLAALRIVGEMEGIDFKPPARRVTEGEELSLKEILHASGVRCREVRLSSEDCWWKGDSGAMLGYRQVDELPVALVPGSSGRYRAIDPLNGQSAHLNGQRAADIQPEAWFFYRPFPVDRPVTSIDAVKLATKGMGVDFTKFAAGGILAGLLMLAPAFAVGLLADWILPDAVDSMLVQIAVALIIIAVVGIVLHILRGTALARLEGRGSARLSSALWDRLLGLPPSFFRNFAAGELAVRVSAFQVMRDQTTGAYANAAVSLAFLLPLLAILFVYDASLAWVSMGVGALSLGITLFLARLQVAPRRRFYAVSRRLAGELFQFINGIGKLRSAGAEASAFASWARGYREQQLAQIQLSRISEHLVALSAALPAFMGAAIFGVALWHDPENLSLGNFLVVYAVSITFYLVVIGLAYSCEAMATALPQYEQVKPILAAVPQDRRGPAAPAELSGDIRFDHVSFRYSSDGPQIVSDVSIHARPAEFIAIVGASGAGKSTLLRLGLGLEDPSAGGVYYDGRDLANLDRRSVRRQVGVVMQDGALRPGNLLDNIIGLDGSLTIDDAWRAARLAAVERDIKAMPMQMFTPVGDSASTFSGGQIQRIRIAAALVRSPRIVFFDEATSWLDAKSQAQVMAGIQSLAATRIVIAHRLSTIRKADRIYVLLQGQVVQEGSFIALFQTEGPFRELVQRQMT